jgi:hypothetical protein
MSVIARMPAIELVLIIEYSRLAITKSSGLPEKA